MDTLAIIKRIEMRLSEIGMSKAEFYNKSGISSASFSQWRTGTYKPSRKKLANASLAIGLPVDYLIDGIGYGGGTGSGAGFGDGTGYGGPILESDSAYDRTNELCSLYGKNFIDLCLDAGLTEHGIQAWKDGTLPDYAVLRKIAVQLLVPVEFLLGEENKKAPTVSGERSINIIRIAGRDGSFVERELTDQQLAALQAILDQLPDVPEGL